MVYSLALLLVTSSSAWATIERGYAEFGKTIVYEYVDPKVPVVSFDRKETRQARLSAFANTLDRLLVERQDSIVLAAKWVPPDLRLLDGLRQWSSKQMGASKGIVRGATGWQFKLKEGETVSVRDLVRLKVVTFDQVSPWFYDARFIIRADDADGDEIVKCIGIALGGRLRSDVGRRLLDVDGKNLRKRRTRMASEQMKRFGPPFGSGPYVNSNEVAFVRSSLEVSLLACLSDDQIRDLFRNGNGDLSISGYERPDVGSSVKAYMDVVRRGGAGRSFVLPEIPQFSAQLHGDGRVTGRVVLANGVPWQF